MKRKIFFSVVLLVIFLFVITGCFIFNPGTHYVAWVVGDLDSSEKAMLLYSDDSGETWIRQGLDILPEGKSLNDVQAVDNKTVWAVGDGALVMKTSDGGANWSIIQIDVVAPDSLFLSVSVYGNDIWISGQNGLIVGSDNNGQDWTVQDLPASATEFLLQGIHVIDDDLIYCVGNNLSGLSGYVLRTTNGGQTWEEIVLPNDYNYSNGWIGVKATDQNHVVINGSEGHFVVTANGGEQWVTGGPIFRGDINDLVMIDSSTYWVACDLDQIFITEDSGISWENHPFAEASNSFLVGIDAHDRERAMIVGQSAGYEQHGKILRTTNGGKDWKVVHTTDINLHKVSIAKK
jgi:photosystem II stability/assembly factor-like uncharacterized protein